MFTNYKNYIKNNPHGYWFKRKWYGWGWTPVKWQGWLAVISYIVLVLAFALTIDPESSTREFAFTFIFPIILLTYALLRIAYKTGEKPKWQWGPKE